MLRALSLCTCCRHYPGTATDGPALLTHSVVSAFPERVVGSACASSFSRLTQRSLTLRPAHSCCHQNLWPAIRRLQPFRYLHDCSGYFRLEHFAGWGSHPLENAAFSRRTPIADDCESWERPFAGRARESVRLQKPNSARRGRSVSVNGRSDLERQREQPAIKTHLSKEVIRPLNVNQRLLIFFHGSSVQHHCPASRKVKSLSALR